MYFLNGKIICFYFYVFLLYRPNDNHGRKKQEKDERKEIEKYNYLSFSISYRIHTICNQNFHRFVCFISDQTENSSEIDKEQTFLDR